MNGSLTTNEVASQLKVQTGWVTRALRLGALNGFKVGNRWRVTEQELQRYIDNHKEGGS